MFLQLLLEHLKMEKKKWCAALLHDIGDELHQWMFQYGGGVKTICIGANTLDN